MKKIISIAIVLMFSLSGTAAVAQEQEKKPGPSIAEWLKGLQRKMEQIIPKKSIPVSTGVAGVRGAKEDSQVKLYWKGKKAEDAVSEQELTGFKEGVDLASNGDKAGAIRQLEEFMKQFPDSALIPDAKKTLDLVKAEPKPEEKAEEKEEKKQ